jgi:uncharacterized protein YegL
MSETQVQEVILFYICCDESVSMAQNGGIDAINFSLPELHAQLVEDPLVVDKSRLAIIAFSDTAQVVLPLSKATDIVDMPGVAEVGGTHYGEAFRALRETIDNDVEMMKAQGFRVYRPVVFFITDGEPTDAGWEAEYNLLMASRYYPHIISWGVDGADAATLQRIATPKMKAFLGGADSATAARALKQMFKSVGQTIVASAGAAGGQIVLPEPPQGVVALEAM